MVYYHGSPVKDIKILNPNVSNHTEAFVYFSSNPVVACFYTVRNNWYPYGFSKPDMIPEYTEFYLDGLKDVYSRKSGCLYECEDLNITENPTNIYCAYVSRNPVEVKRYRIIEDMYEEMLLQEQKGVLKIKRHKNLNEMELERNRARILKAIKDGDLLHSEDDYAKFIKERFPYEWEKANLA